MQVANTFWSMVPPNFSNFWENLNFRLITLITLKTSWYDNSILNKKTSWHLNLPLEWAGDKPIQFKIRDMKYSTTLQVPNTANGQLLRSLAKIEHKLAKSTSYQVKLTEKSGKPLSKFFSLDFSSSYCHRAWCDVCSNTTKSRSTLCSVKSVVYSSVRDICDKNHKKSPNDKHAGLYIGQTYRTLSEQTKEHRLAYRRMEKSSFMYKHWVFETQRNDDPP